MKVEFEATGQQISKLMQMLAGVDDLKSIYTQLSNTIADNDEEQADEIPKEGDNDIIKRAE